MKNTDTILGMDFTIVDDPNYYSEDQKSASVTRSPNYPVISFVDALERAKNLFKALRLGKADDSFVARALGYSGLSGRSRGVVSALKKYGLISSEGKQSRLSEDARTLVMLTPDNETYRETVRRCALMPPIFLDLFHQYGFDLPVDKHMEFWLIERRFNSYTATDLVKIYKENINFVRGLEGYGIEESNEDDKSSLISKGSKIIGNSMSKGVSLNKIKELNFPLAGDCAVRIVFTGDLKRESIEKTMRYLEIFAEDFPTNTKLIGEEDKSPLPN